MASGNITVPKNGSDPIAVVGIGCRFPGDATTPEKLWELISNGRSAWSAIPKDRFNADAFYHPQAGRQGTINTRGGHFLKDDVAAFDAPFFSITPSEATAMDPQQRLMLEVAYESLENAGISMKDIVGSKTSCYVGCFTKDYSDILDRDSEDNLMYSATGTGTAMLSNRLSWFFDLKGPSVSIDTACSSSLVALHLACQSLRTGESEMAIVGGVNIILDPTIMITMTALNFLSPDAKCQSFDHKANGYARGEGAASLILKPLEAALRDNDTIRALIRGSAVNQDGKTPGITLPSMQAQSALIETAYQSAGLNPADTSYFEAHGTGTPAGDPLEMGALASVFGKTRTAQNPLYVGSIKSNIGHLEGASGLAGMIKAIYAIEKGIIPANLWFDKANPRIPMEEWKVMVPTKSTPWPKKGLRRVSVNSFGYGGTNAHVIMDDAFHYLSSQGLRGNHNVIFPDYHDMREAQASDSGIGTSPFETGTPAIGGSSNIDFDTFGGHRKLVRAIGLPRLFVWSSNDQGGTQRLYKSCAEYLQENNPGISQTSLMKRLSYTLSSRRSILPWKTFCVASSIAELGKSIQEGLVKPIRSSRSPKLAFIFTGQGAQWYCMGRELFAYQTYQQSLEDADRHLLSLGCSWSLIGNYIQSIRMLSEEATLKIYTEELFRDEKSSNINLPAYSQPICTAVQVALVDLLAYWGIKPTAVVGHSSGEIAGAYCKGAFSRNDAWKIAYYRGKLTATMNELAPSLNGGMLVAGLGEDHIQSYLERVSSGRVYIACVNSPSNTTLSGDMDAIIQIKALLDADGIFARKLKVETAYHSPHMKLISDAYLNSIEDVEIVTDSDSGVVMFSSVTGDAIDSSQLGPQYWVDNLVSKVRFSQAIHNLVGFTTGKKRRGDLKSFVDIMVEVGPHAALQSPLKQILSVNKKAASDSYLSLLHRGNNAVYTALDALGRLFISGYPVDVLKVNMAELQAGKNHAILTDLPPYRWNRNTRYWFESHLSENYRFRKYPRLDLLGAPTSDFNPLEPRWRNFLSLAQNPWVQDHRVQSSILYPAAGMIVMAIEGVHQLNIGKREVTGYQLRDVKIGTAIIIPLDDERIETMLQLRPWKLGSQSSTSHWQEFTVFSKAKGEDWQEHCSGLISTRYLPDDNTAFIDGIEETREDERYRQRFLTAKEICVQAHEPRQLYESLGTIGLYYGPTFQNLVEVHSDVNEGTCVLRIPDTKAVMPQKFEYPHIIHPATLDTMFQMVFPTLTKAEESPLSVMVPTFLESLYISCNISNRAGDELHGHSVAKRYSYREVEASIVFSEPAWKKPQVIVIGLRCTSLSAMTEGIMPTDAVLAPRKLCLEFSWKEDIDLLTHEQTKALLNKEIAAVDRVGSVVAKELELAAYIYTRRVLKSFDPEQALAFAPHLKLYYEWMQHQQIIAVQGLLEHQAADRTDWLGLSIENETQVLRRVAADSPDGKLLCQVGENLDGILKGTIEPLEVMLKDDMLRDFYEKGIGSSEILAMLTRYIDRLAHKRPDIKILEIGAGTGGTTSWLYRSLGGRQGSAPRFGSYTFTDISTGFFEKAQERFKEWGPYIKFQKLNIEEDPVAQNFDLHSYDVVVAVNVLHATHSMSKTLMNVKSLLKPGGKLVLGEITHVLMKHQVIFGTLPGWWLSEDDGRKWGPTLTETSWNEVLNCQGFSGIDLSLRDYEDPKEHSTSLIISTAPQIKTLPFLRDIIVVGPSVPSPDLQTLYLKLTDELLLLGSSTTIVRFEDLIQRNIEGKICIILAEVDHPLLHSIQHAEFLTLKHLMLRSANVFWVTRGGSLDSPVPEMNLITGLARTLRTESNISLVTLDLDFKTPISADTNAKCISRLLSSLWNTESPRIPDFEYTSKEGLLFIPRLVEQDQLNNMFANQGKKSITVLLPFSQPGRPLKLEVGVQGMLNTLQFVDDPDATTELKEEEVEIEVKASGLNIADIMIAMGQVSDSVLGAECSGVVTRVGNNVTRCKPGDRVVTWRVGCYKNYVRNAESMVQLIPDNITYESAASIPIIYCTVYYSLYRVARLQKGESILIHAAAGGVGQAAIILAKNLGAEIFATVGTQEKKNLIIEQYGIPDDHIFYSRDLSFAKGIMRMTKGRGVDVVLNSLAGEALRKTWHCIAMFGRFIELGKKDIVGNTGLDMAPFLRNVTFSSVDLYGMYRHNIVLASKIFDEVMSLMHQGIIRAVTPTKIYKYSQMEDAFRFMQAGEHIGKIVLKPSNEDLVPVMNLNRQNVCFDANSSYVLAGGLGGLGRSIAKWMVNNGAKHLIFLSRSGLLKPEAKKLVEELTSAGASIASFACDLTDEKSVKAIAEDCTRDLPPICGVIQGAMVLQDSLFENMTFEQMTAAIRPKVQGTRNLHEYLPKDLDFFVMLSSIAGVAGNRGQGNYSAGNTYQDAFAQYRAGQNLRATSIDLGSVFGVGFIAENENNPIHENHRNLGLMSIYEDDVLALIGAAITGTAGGAAASLPRQLVTGLGTGGFIKELGVDEPYWMTDAKFAHMRLIDTVSTLTSSENTVIVQLPTLLAEATTLADATKIICDSLLSKISRITTLPIEDLEPGKPANAYGVDSLVAVEVRNWVFREINADVNVFDILSGTPMSALAGKIAARSGLVPFALRDGMISM